MNIPFLRTRTRARTRGAAIAAIAITALVLTACTSGNGGDGGGGDEPADAGPCAGPAVTADGLKPVRIGLVFGLGNYAVQVAADEGYFEENGIDADIIEVANPTTRIPGLCSEFDVVPVTVPEVIESSVRGADIGIFAGLMFTSLENPATPFVSSPATGPIEDVEDLVGLTVGVFNLTGSSPDSVRWLLDEAGVGADAANLVAVPLPAMIDQLSAGLIDAAILPEPFVAAATGAGMIKTFDPIAEAAGSPGAVIPFASSSAWVDANADLIDGFRAAITQAIEHIEADPQAALEGAAAWLDVPPVALTGALFPPMSTEITAAQLEAWVTILTDIGTLTESVDAEELLLAQ